MRPNMKKLLLCLAIPLAVGGLSALLSGGMQDYLKLNQPPLSPPGWIFPLVWTALYLMMGYASYLVAASDAPAAQKKRALLAYGAQLILNFLWSPIFFGMQAYLAAFFILLALWVLIYITLRLFSNINERAGDLLIPYLLWVSFAAYLNLGVFLLN